MTSPAVCGAMRILILDDDENRHRAFIGALRGHSLTHAWTSQEANHHLHDPAHDGFDVVFLDHDLGEFGEHSAGTGLHVAHEVAGLSEDRRPTLTVVHSHNPDGAAEMMRVLYRAGLNAQREPFCEHLLTRLSRAFGKALSAGQPGGPT